MSTKAFLVNSLDVGQIVTVGQRRETMLADHAVDLFLRLSLDFWMQCHGQEENFQCSYSLVRISF